MRRARAAGRPRSTSGRGAAPPRARRSPPRGTRRGERGDQAAVAALLQADGDLERLVDHDDVRPLGAGDVEACVGLAGPPRRCREERSRRGERPAPRARPWRSPGGSALGPMGSRPPRYSHQRYGRHGQRCSRAAAAATSASVSSATAASPMASSSTQETQPRRGAAAATSAERASPGGCSASGQRGSTATGACAAMRSSGAAELVDVSGRGEV